MALVVAIACGCAKGGPLDTAPTGQELHQRQLDQQQAEADAQSREQEAALEEVAPAEPVPEPSPAPPARAAELTAADKAALSAADEHGAHMRAQAKRHGFKDVLLGESLTSVLTEVVANAYDIRKIKPIAIELGGDDAQFVAEQVLDGGLARFASDYCEAQFVLKGYRGSVYEGTALGALNLEAVRIVGVKSFPSAVGGTVQAFVVEPAWQ